MKQKTYKLIIAITEMNGTEIEYHNNPSAVLNRQEYWNSKGYATMIMIEETEMGLQYAQIN